MLWTGYVLFPEIFCDGLLLGSLLYHDWCTSSVQHKGDEAATTHTIKKRRVTFADTEGLPLTQTKRLSITDTSYTPGVIVPKVENRATERLQSSNPTSSSSCSTTTTRSFKFTQPSCNPDFMQRVTSQKISLEGASLNTQGTMIQGSVRVDNIAYDKEVVVRWTKNNWLSFRESQCMYCSTLDDGKTDRFAFTLVLTDSHSNIEFVIRYKVNGHEYWDNNHQHNYILSVDS